ncbi:hypothetical protein [Luteimonas sp. R10]|uniref:hypothetical protein n=1 Tax=Luteimonas sp. R10 TaxID=3108176 RepID=UPI00309181CE|nr:hypothetical protein U3649_10050 [Luteimonas sp. R10]
MDTDHRRETETRIRELRQSIEALERELESSSTQDQAQHEVLEHLDEYINAVDTKISSLKLFWQALKEEWRKQ